MIARATVRSTRVTFGGVLHAEWIKIWSLRSTAWIGALAVICSALISVFQASGTAFGSHDGSVAAAVELAIVTSGVGVAQLLVCVVAVHSGASEFRNEACRVTFAVVPRRHLVVMAKFAAVALFAGATGMFGTMAAALGMSPILTERGYPILVGRVDVLLPIVSSWLFLAACAVISCAVGLLARSAAMAISFVLTVMALVPFALVVASVSAQDPFAANLAFLFPSTPAASSMYIWPGFVVPSQSGSVMGHVLLQPWQGAFVILAWAVVVAALAIGVVRRRDV